MTVLKSLYGQYLKISEKGALWTIGKRTKRQLTPDCVDATITVAAEIANVRQITIQLKDGFGGNIAAVTNVRVYMFSTTAHTALATGGSTGIADAGAGFIAQTLVAKLIFDVFSDANGAIALSWTDTGTESVVLGLKLPNGNMVYTAAFANT